VLTEPTGSVPETVLRVEDVVKMHQDADRQARQNLEQEKSDVTAGFHDVRAVDEQDVVTLQ
jgi:hypothetical protein